MLRKLNAPSIDIRFVLNQIKESYKNEAGYYKRLTDGLIDTLIEEERKYTINDFYSTERNEEISGYDKKMAKNFYEEKIVANNVGNIYSTLLGNPKETCPICNAEADSLDHILPKAKYVQYSITPINLVPMCLSCNKKKGEHYNELYENSSFHPYYEDYEELIGLNARLAILPATSKIVVEFYFDSRADPKCRYNFIELFELDAKCSCLANNYLKNMMTSIAKRFTNGELNKMDTYSIIEKKYQNLEEGIDEKWKILTCKAILDDFDIFINLIDSFLN